MQYNTIRYVVAVLGACLCALSAERGESLTSAMRI
jgi:hypothetical protein